MIGMFAISELMRGVTTLLIWVVMLGRGCGPGRRRRPRRPNRLRKYVSRLADFLAFA
ncbi:hypothetical protein [Humitalea rosea]|uniref:hypothetical protein n=1 Tax=Humitalea rosea TaxID=990373 RepID=UPI0013150112|nr:hypothetical protein [Humitalea rosea]